MQHMKSEEQNYRLLVTALHDEPRTQLTHCKLHASREQKTNSSQLQFIYWGKCKPGQVWELRAFGTLCKYRCKWPLALRLLASHKHGPQCSKVSPAAHNRCEPEDFLNKDSCWRQGQIWRCKEHGNRTKTSVPTSLSGPGTRLVVWVLLDPRGHWQETRSQREEIPPQETMTGCCRQSCQQYSWWRISTAETGKIQSHNNFFASFLCPSKSNIVDANGYFLIHLFTSPKRFYNNNKETPLMYSRVKTYSEGAVRFLSTQ